MLAESWLDVVKGLDEDVVVPAVMFICLGLAGIVWAIALAWRAVKQSEQRAQLTAMMLERGLKPDEIERILLAAAAKPGAAADPPDPDPEVAIVKHLTDNDYDGDDVQKVLGAVRQFHPIDDATVRLVKTMAENWAEADDIASVIRNRRPRGGASHTVAATSG
jgi:hypothetical protein